MLGLALAMTASSAGAQTVVSSDVTTDTTWSGEIVLTKPIFVKNGATLSINQGTIVRGQPRTDLVTPGSQAGTPGALIVTRTGRIEATGQASAPIIFTTAAVDNDGNGVADDADGDGFRDPWQPGDAFLDDDPLNAPLAPLDKDGNANVSLWGGIVILGNAPTNLADQCGTPYGTCTIEGLTIPGFSVLDSTYGGVQPHDNSGSLEFVSIRHAGDEIGEGNELNCLSLGGVGDATIISNVECYANFDDGFEWFGGTVNGDRLAAFFIGDDSFDLDQGYTGTNQFLFAIMPFFNQNGGNFGSASGDKAGEFDGDDLLERAGDANIRLKINSAVSDQTAWPFPNPSLWNMTVIGSTPDAGQCFDFPQGSLGSPASDNRGIQMRHGYAGNIWNSVIVNTGSEKGILVDTGTGEGASDTIAHVNDGLVAVVASTLDDGAPLGAAESTVIANGDALASTLGGQANVVNGAFPGLVQEDTTFDPTGNAAGKLDASLLCKGPIDPRPGAGLVGLAGGVKQTLPGLENATFRGAFDRTAQVLWTTGWTTLSRAGMLAQ